MIGNAFTLLGPDVHLALKHPNHQALDVWGPGALLNHNLGPWTQSAAPGHHSGAKLLHNLTGVNFVTISLNP